MAKPKTVQIEKDDMSGEVLETALRAWVRNGWTAVDTSNSESGEVPVAPPVSDEPDATVQNEGEVQ